jgi:tRNA A37 N6-isopentenylltransferase MiaA
MKRMTGRDHNWSPESTRTLRRELTEQYAELPAQSVATALDQATRAAAALLHDTDDQAAGTAALVAMLARDRLNAQRARRAAAARRIEHRSSYGRTAR